MLQKKERGEKNARAEGGEAEEPVFSEREDPHAVGHGDEPAVLVGDKRALVSSPPENRAQAGLFDEEVLVEKPEGKRPDPLLVSGQFFRGFDQILSVPCSRCAKVHVGERKDQKHEQRDLCPQHDGCLEQAQPEKAQHQRPRGSRDDQDGRKPEHGRKQRDVQQWNHALDRFSQEQSPPHHHGGRVVDRQLEAVFHKHRRPVAEPSLGLAEVVRIVAVKHDVKLRADDHLDECERGDDQRPDEHSQPELFQPVIGPEIEASGQVGNPPVHGHRQRGPRAVIGAEAIADRG